MGIAKGSTSDRLPSKCFDCPVDVDVRQVGLTLRVVDPLRSAADAGPTRVAKRQGKEGRPTRRHEVGLLTPDN